MKANKIYLSRKTSNEKALGNLQIEKLSLEIKNAKLRRQPSFWTAISTIFIAAIGLYYTISTGLFSNERKLIELQNLKLELKRDTLFNQIKDLETTVNIIERKQDSIKTLYNHIVYQKDSLYRIIKNTKEIKQTKEGLKSELYNIVQELKFSIRKEKEEHAKILNQKNSIEKYNLSLKISQSNTLLNDYHQNYQARIKSLLSKLEQLSPKQKFRESRFRLIDSPTNRIGLEDLVSDLEVYVLGYK